jgi:hypothetical protein
MIFDPFADLNRTVRERCENGYTIVDLSQTCHEVYRAILGDGAMIRNVPWSALPEGDQERWEPVARMAMCLFDLREEGSEITISVAETAKNFYKQFTAMSDATDYTKLPEIHHIAWQAIVRHLGNIVDSDGKIDLSETEQRIVEWARAKVGSTQLVLS